MKLLVLVTFGLVSVVSVLGTLYTGIAQLISRMP